MPYILVATPGRLIDHMKSSRVNGVPFSEIISNVSVWVLDEADRCLDMVRYIPLSFFPSLALLVLIMFLLSPSQLLPLSQ